MITAILCGVCIALALISAMVGCRRISRRGRDVLRNPMHQSSAPPAPLVAAPPKPAHSPPSVSCEDMANTINGWMLGHEIAHGHTGFPGDPLPGGHLGSASDLAFWGGIFDDDPDDPDF